MFSGTLQENTAIWGGIRAWETWHGSPGLYLSLGIGTDRKGGLVLSKYKFSKMPPVMLSRWQPVVSVDAPGNVRKVADAFDVVEVSEGAGSEETRWGLAGSLQSWRRGFCNGLAHCANYGNEKMTFGAGTRLTVKPSKYFTPSQETSLLDFRDQTGLTIQA